MARITICVCASVLLALCVACGSSTPPPPVSGGAAPATSAASPAKRKDAREKQPPAAPKAPIDRVTLGNFYRVKTGMTEAQVFAILGDRCELLSESEIAGFHTRMLVWKSQTTLGGNCNVMFQNGRVIQKAQFALAGDATEADEKAERDAFMPTARPAQREFTDEQLAEFARQAEEERRAEKESIKPARREHPLRTWTSKGGSFSVQARFLRASGGSVILRKEDGEELTVATGNLSPDDQAWIEGLRK